MWMVQISIWTFDVCIKPNTGFLRFPRSRDLPASLDKLGPKSEPTFVTDQYQLAEPKLWAETTSALKSFQGVSSLEARLALWLHLWLISGANASAGADDHYTSDFLEFLDCFEVNLLFTEQKYPHKPIWGRKKKKVVSSGSGFN